MARVINRTTIEVPNPFLNITQIRTIGSTVTFSCDGMVGTGILRQIIGKEFVELGDVIVAELDLGTYRFPITAISA